MDLSLRSNPESYIDRDNESEKILNRINNDASTVIGISGLRGAGKSSLAKKVLNQCDGNGYFTLLIHSPSGYDSREFLITIYSRICESVIRKLENKFGIDNTLEGKASSIKRELQKYIRTVFVGAILLVLAMGSTYFYAYSKQKDEAEATYKKAKEAEINDELSALTKERDRILNLEKAFVSLDSIKLAIVDEKIGVLKETKYRIDDISYSNRSLFLQESVITIFSGIIFYALLIFAYFLVRPRLKLRRRINEFPKEYGLYKIAQENLEYLKYQSTHSDGREIQANLWKLSSKLVKNKSLQSRPISLPGLTSDLAVFLDHVSDVFRSKVVLCLDELDKITDSKQLEDLLIGIKGILGQKNVYFVLTVSEDALSNFVTRLRGERNLIESSFEEIIHLNRIKRSLALEIIELSCANSETDEQESTISINGSLIWAFSGGIPRELKRNLLKLRDNDLDISRMNSFSVWRIFYKDLIHSMKEWVLISSFNELDKKYALIILNKSYELIPKELPSEPCSFSLDLLAIYNSVKAENSDFLKQNIFDDVLLEKGLLEAFTSSLYLTVCSLEKGELNSTLALIQSIGASIPYSADYTKSEIIKYLNR